MIKCGGLELVCFPLRGPCAEVRGALRVRGTQFENHWFGYFCFKMLPVLRERGASHWPHLALPRLSWVGESWPGPGAAIGDSFVSMRYSCLCLLPLFTFVGFLSG